MSDASMYELEDIVWDDFVGNDDHIVPGDEKCDGFAIHSDGHTRLRRGVTSGSSSDDKTIVAEKVGQSKEESISFTMEETGETMLQKGTWSHPSDGVFPASSDGDFNSKVSGSASDDILAYKHHLQSSNLESVGSELCADGSVLRDQGASLDNNLCRYPLPAASTDNDISFFSNDHQDKEDSDLLYCAWPEMENFEDVDRMFRDCDSFFDVGIDNDNTLSWLSSSHAVESSDAAFKPSLEFSGPDPSAPNSVTDCPEAFKPIVTGQLTNDTDNEPTLTNWKTDAQKLAGGSIPPVSHSSFASEVISETENLPQVDLHQTWSKNQKSSEEKKDLYLENGNTYIPVDNLNQIKQPRHSFENSNLQFSSCSGTPQNPTRVEVHGDSVCDNSLQSQFTFIPSNLVDPSQVSASPAASAVKPEAKGHQSLSQKKSSASSQDQSAVNSHDVSFQNPTVKGERKKERLYHPNRYLSHPRDVGKLPGACYDSNAVRKQVSQMQSEVKDQSEVNGKGSAVPAVLDSSHVQESSCVSSVLDDVSLEASSFHQLQVVMEKLDKKTKLCIRDSLYRLARSAEQRHKGSRVDRAGTGAFTTDATNKCAGFMDVETDTNPIDRSIAHLLFHRPSDTSATPGRNIMPVKPPAEVHASSSNGPSLTSDKSVSGGEVLDVADNRPVEHIM